MKSTRPEPFRNLASCICVGVIGAVSLFPSASHADFLQSLFGIAPVETATEPLTVRRHRAPTRRRSTARKTTHERLDVPPAADGKAGRRKVVGILDDPTLRDGDVLMASDGIRIYVGPVSSVHAVKQFVPLALARHVVPAVRGRLAALDVTASAKADFTSQRRAPSPHKPLAPMRAGTPMRQVGP